MKSWLTMFSLMFIWTGVLASNVRPPEGNVPDAVELAVLQDIYTTMGGSNWTNKTNWPTSWPATATSADYATWYGIVVTNNDITGIDLHSNLLSGALPSSIGNLTALTTLYLPGNSISGALPSSVGNLALLQVLHLGNNAITSIPATIGNLSSLKVLYLHVNQITGSVPVEIGNLGNLEILGLWNNQLTGGIPSSIGNLSHLQQLAMQNNGFTGAIPSSIGNLTALTSIELNNNQLSGAIPASIGNLTLLSYLALGNNNLTSLPDEICNLTALTSLYVHVNQLSGSIPANIGNLANLTVLSLWSNQLTGSIPSSIGNLTKLQALAVEVNQLSGSIPSSIGSLTALRGFTARNNQLSGAIPNELNNLSSLIELRLDNNHLTSLPSSLAGMTSLHDFYVDHNQITGSFPSSLLNVAGLINLSLGNNQFTGSIPSSISNLNQLQSLLIADNSFSGDFPPAISNMTALRTVRLTRNSFTGSFPSINALTNLGELDIEGNHFNALPGFASLTALSLLNVQRNNLTMTDLLTAKSGFQGPPSSFYYAVQNSADEVKTINRQVGQTLTLTTSIDRSTSPASTYQWYKNVNGVVAALNTLSGSSHTIDLTNIQAGDSGTQYFYIIKNSDLPLLTLTSNLQTLQIVTCITPTVDFTTSTTNFTYTFNPSVTNAESCSISYLWDFGDGESSTDATASHVYNTTGTYSAKLTLTYQCGACDSAQVVVAHDVTVTNTSICTSVFCDGIGGVGIGTMRTQGYRLSVDGKIRAASVKVYPQTQWSDFVFEDKYKLTPLNEVEKFIKTNGHLPGIPSAQEVEKEGVELGSMDAKLLQKIEELTLYVIELKKENENMKTEIKALKKR